MGGVYNSQAPTNSPPTYTSLPYDLTDFTLDLDIDGISDGGIWLHTDAAGQNGVLLVTGGNGWGVGLSGSTVGTSIYWGVVKDGVAGPQAQEVDNVFTPGQNVHLTVIVSGNTYQAYIDGTLQTTFTDSTYTHGRVGLYDFSPASAQNQSINQTFDNVVLTAPPSTFFTGQVALSQGVYYLAFPANGNIFGYYSYLSDPRYIYHFDLGFEYVFDANDGNSGVYLYDFKSKDFFYTSTGFPFPYLYDFSMHTTLYYYPDPNNAGHYNTDGVRYFYDFATGKMITK